NFYGYGEKTLSEIVGDLLKERCATVATCESCTGGSLASEIVSVPGASAYFQGSFITYSNELKQKVVGVKAFTLEQFGAVSEQTVIEMANGTKERLEVDYAVSISGIAGPDGGTEEKPVGTVWIAVATPKAVITRKFLLVDNRERFIQRTVLSALNLLRNAIIETTR
ncbi:MAG TPA: nicotinamide-nucleotide amidohydrolase family protein, partial [Taishania sp.]|nr:nicotinamide-nucleotide amidohydrolase family protein [Taishania sp.]